MSKHIARVTEDYDGGQPDVYLTIRDTESPYYAPEPEDQRVTVSDVTANELAEMLDRNAEGANYHDFVGLGEKLADLLTLKVGEYGAREVLYDIGMAGGFMSFTKGITS